MERRKEEKVVREKALHRHCRLCCVSLSIPPVTLQLSAPAYSIPIQPAHAHTHTHTEHAALSAHVGEGH